MMTLGSYGIRAVGLIIKNRRDNGHSKPPGSNKEPPKQASKPKPPSRVPPVGPIDEPVGDDTVKELEEYFGGATK